MTTLADVMLGHAVGSADGDERFEYGFHRK